MKIKKAIAELKHLEKEFGGDQHICCFYVCPNFVIDSASHQDKSITAEIAGKILKEVMAEEEREGRMFCVFSDLVDAYIADYEPDPLDELVGAAKSKKKGKK